MDKNAIVIQTYNKIADIYTKAFFDDDSDLPYIEKFLTFLPPHARILDLGCGPGTHTKHFYKKGYSVEGIDLSEEMIAIAQKKLPEVPFKTMDMRKLAYESNTFDGLFAAYSLIHVPSQFLSQTIKGFYTVLKDGGVIMIVVQKGKPDQLINEPFMPSEKMLYSFFTTKQLLKLLTDAGFTIVYKEEKPYTDPDGLSDTLIYVIAKK